MAAPHRKQPNPRRTGGGNPGRQNPGRPGRSRRSSGPPGRSKRPPGKGPGKGRPGKSRAREPEHPRSGERASGRRGSDRAAPGSGKPGGSGGGPRRKPARRPGGKPSGARRAGRGPLRSKQGGKDGRPGRKPGRKPPRRPGAAPRRPARRSDGRPGPRSDRKPPHTGAGPDNLPRWMREEIHRTTQKERRDAVLKVIAEGIDAYGNEEFEAARSKLAKARQLSPRSPSVRELLGLSAYRLERWDEALAEMRAYRRLVGDTSYMPAEMDCLRALGRGADVEKTWERFGELGGGRPAEAEARVVYGAFLLDQGRPAEAWAVTRPSRLPPGAPPYELRRWFIAARAALEIGDAEAAEKLTGAVRRADPGMAGLDELMSRIDAGSRP